MVATTIACAFSTEWIQLISHAAVRVGGYVIAELAHTGRGVRCTVPMCITCAECQPDGMFHIEDMFTRDLTAEEMFGLR